MLLHTHKSVPFFLIKKKVSKQKIEINKSSMKNIKWKIKIFPVDLMRCLFPL